jgi:hypothetical protein
LAVEARRALARAAADAADARRAARAAAEARAEAAEVEAAALARRVAAKRQTLAREKAERVMGQCELALEKLKVEKTKSRLVEEFVERLDEVTKLELVTEKSVALRNMEVQVDRVRAEFEELAEAAREAEFEELAELAARWTEEVDVDEELAEFDRVRAAEFDRVRAEAQRTLDELVLAAADRAEDRLEAAAEEARLEAAEEARADKPMRETTREWNQLEKYVEFLEVEGTFADFDINEVEGASARIVDQELADQVALMTSKEAVEIMTIIIEENEIREIEQETEKVIVDQEKLLDVVLESRRAAKPI